MYRTLFTLMLAPLLAMQCGEKNKPKDQCLEGKIIRTSCASLVVQVLNNDSVGEDGWKNAAAADSASYDNVFSVANICKLSQEIKPGTTFYFIIDKPQTTDCVVCMMYDAPPKTQFDIRNVSTKPCK